MARTEPQTLKPPSITDGNYHLEAYEFYRSYLYRTFGPEAAAKAAQAWEEHRRGSSNSDDSDEEMRI